MKLHASLACGLALVLGCGDDVVLADQGDESATEETGEPPALECEPLRVFAEPVGLFVEPSPSLLWGSSGKLGIAPGGDVVLINHSKLRRVDPSGVLRWEQPASEDTIYSHVGITSAGEIIVIGKSQSDDRSVIERFDPEGLLLARATFDHDPDASESLILAAVSPRGDVIIEHDLEFPGDDDLHWGLIYIDSDLNVRWRGVPTSRMFPDLAFDDAGNAYSVNLDYPTIVENPVGGPPVYSWPVDLRAHTPDGDELWLETVEVLDTGVPTAEVTVGDQIYLRTNTGKNELAKIRAYDFEGVLQWEQVFEQDIMPVSIAASPCGGLHAVGEVASPEQPDWMRQRSIWSFGPDGELGPITPQPEEDGIGAGSILVSPLDDVIVFGDAGSYTWVVSY